jgi:hypothetical protein
VAPFARLSVSVIPRVGLFVELGALIALPPRRYLMSEEGAEGTVPLLSPWPVQPITITGFYVDVW